MTEAGANSERHCAAGSLGRNWFRRDRVRRFECIDAVDLRSGQGFAAKRLVLLTATRDADANRAPRIDEPGVGASHAPHTSTTSAIFSQDQFGLSVAGRSAAGPMPFLQ